jgi:hypothetical protein
MKNIAHRTVQPAAIAIGGTECVFNREDSYRSARLLHISSSSRSLLDFRPRDPVPLALRVEKSFERSSLASLPTRLISHN